MELIVSFVGPRPRGPSLEGTLDGTGDVTVDAATVDSIMTLFELG